jgi:hypothetical protein
VIEAYYDRPMPTEGGIPAVVDGGTVEVDHAGLTHDDGTFVARRPSAVRPAACSS